MATTSRKRKGTPIKNLRKTKEELLNELETITKIEDNIGSEFGSIPLDRSKMELPDESQMPKPAKTQKSKTPALGKAVEAKPVISSHAKFACFKCGTQYFVRDYVERGKSDNSFVNDVVHFIPYCRDCMEDIYKHYNEKYSNEGYVNAMHKAFRRLCMAIDMYYSDKLVEVVKENAYKKNIDIFSSFLQMFKFRGFANKCFDNTLEEEERAIKGKDLDLMKRYVEDVRQETRIRFGRGLPEEEYAFLQEEYDRWLDEYECKTKGEQDLIIMLCFSKWNIFAAQKEGREITKLNSDFSNLLNTMNLTPKQAKGNIVEDTEGITIGTLIAEFENDNPIPKWEDAHEDFDDYNEYFNNSIKTPLVRCLGVEDKFSTAEEMEEFEEYFADHSIVRGDVYEAE